MKIASVSSCRMNGPSTRICTLSLDFAMIWIRLLTPPLVRESLSSINWERTTHCGPRLPKPISQIDALSEPTEYFPDPY